MNICIIYFPRAPSFSNLESVKAGCYSEGTHPVEGGSVDERVHQPQDGLPYGKHTHADVPTPTQMFPFIVWGRKPRCGVLEEELEYFIFLRHLSGKVPAS